MADGHPIIHLRFFSSETGVGIGSKTAALRLILPSFSWFLNQNEIENSLPLIKKFLSPPPSPAPQPGSGSGHNACSIAHPLN